VTITKTNTEVKLQKKTINRPVIINNHQGTEIIKKENEVLTKREKTKMK